MGAQRPADCSSRSQTGGIWRRFGGKRQDPSILNVNGEKCHTIALQSKNNMDAGARSEVSQLQPATLWRLETGTTYVRDRISGSQILSPVPERF